VATADVEFDNPCHDPFVFESTAQTDPTQTAYSDTPIVLDLTKFTISPERCKIAYTCTNVVREDTAASDIACSDLISTGLFLDETATSGTLSLLAKESDYENLVYAPGVYIVTITGTASNSQNSAKKTRTATFKITLVDPCDPPASLSKPAIVNQVYTITDDNADPYTHPEFVVSPLYCPVTYQYNVSLLSNNESAITQDSVDKKKFTFFYNQDLDPLTDS